MKGNQEIRKMYLTYVNKNREVEEELEKSRLAYEKKLRFDLLLEKSGYDDKYCVPFYFLNLFYPKRSHSHHACEQK